MRLLAMSLLFCAALTTGGVAAERISPAAGQTIEEFEAANDAELTATPGNKIGYTVQKCPLKPPPFGSTEEIFIGYGPRHSHGDETKVDLIGVRDGKVTEWKELLLPDFQGWLTHYVWEAGHSRSLTTPKCTSAFAGPAPISRRSRLPRSESNGWSAQARDAGC